MSRFDYPDPGQDVHYCDGLSDDPSQTSSVTVERQNGTKDEWDDACADVFGADELTVSYLDPVLDEASGPARVFPAGTWTHATVRDGRGNVLAQFVASVEAQMRRSA